MNERRILLILFLSCLLVRTAFFLISENDLEHDFDPVTKVYLALVWQESKSAIPDINFGPLHTYLIAAALSLWNNVSLASRALSLLFGSALIFPFFFLARDLFGRQAALLSGIFLCVYPVHVRVSVVSEAVAPFIFFLVCALYFFFRFQREKGLAALILSALSLNLAGMLRFEGWVFIPLLMLLLFKRDRKYLFPFFLMSMVFPAFWMYLSFKSSGDPLSFARTAADAAYIWESQKTLARRMGEFMSNFGRTMTPLVSLLAFSGLCWSLYQRKRRSLGALFLIFSAYFIYRVLAAQMSAAMSKYYCLLGILIIPYAFFFLSLVSGRITNQKARRAALSLAMICVVFFSLQRGLVEAKEHRAAPDKKNAALWIKANLGSNDSMILDDYYHPYFVVESGLKPGQFYSAAFFTAPGALKENLLEILREKTPGYIMYSFDEGNFRNLLKFSPENPTQERLGYIFKCVYVSGACRIYAISKAKRGKCNENRIFTP